MFRLGLDERLSVEVRVDNVATVPYYGDGTALNVTVTVRFFGGTEVRLLLWAPTDAAESLQVEKEFVRREVILQGRGPSDPDNPYSSGSVYLTTIWFDDPEGKRPGKQPLQVLRDVYVP